jgi:ribonuclease P protein component
MIPQKLRLKRSRIEHIFLKGKKISPDNYISAKYLPSLDSACHFCVIVSAKTAPKAVQRNLLRRQIYETIRLNLDLLAKSCDIAFICKKPAVDLPFINIQKKITNIFKLINQTNQ